MLKKLIEINNSLITSYASDERKLERQFVISNLLKNDDCFFELPIEEAFSLLKDLGISDYEEIYLNLVSYENYNK